MGIITLEDYKNALLNRGKNLSEVRKTQADMIMNVTFTGDIGYKKVYILDKDTGWNYVDAKYGKHASYSILKDAVDSYLEFRPHVHYPVGTYVFIPDDDSPDIGFHDYQPDDPFQDPNFNVNKLWMIVGRDDATQFIRYNIIRCNWNFRWIYKVHGEMKILHVWGSVRNANSYTSGIWRADYMTQLDQVTNGWMPDTYQLYGDKLYNYNLCDSRYIQHDERFMITNNVINPKVYQVTKVQDLVPLGIIKMTFKQTEVDKTVDNIDLLLCNYYNRMGEVRLKEPIDISVENRTSIIYHAIINDDMELEKDENIVDTINISMGDIYYFIAEFTEDDIIMDNVETEWRVTLIDEENTYDVLTKEYIENLIKIIKYDYNTIAIKVGKSKKLSGNSFILSVKDKDGYYTASVKLEVE